jgi:lysyl-tRNA synthetase class 2
LTVLIDYPPTEAALACLVSKNGSLVAERFEIYHQGVELANGYHECTNGEELRARFEKENGQRKTRGQDPYILDETFLKAVTTIPDCCGVSVGFDRAFMLQQKATTLADVIPWGR